MRLVSLEDLKNSFGTIVLATPYTVDEKFADVANGRISGQSQTVWNILALGGRYLWLGEEHFFDHNLYFLERRNTDKELHRDLIYRILPFCRKKDSLFLENGKLLPLSEKRGVSG